MRALLLIALLPLVPPDRPNPTPKETPKTLQEQILGEWRIEKFDFGGGIPAPPMPENEARTLQFTKSEILVAVNGQPQAKDSTGYTIDMTKNPVAIDILPRNGPDQKLQGILKLEGDQLTMCFSVMGARPKEFNTKGGELAILMHLKRIKK